MNIITRSLTKRFGHGVSASAQRTSVLGSQYTWDRTLLSQNASILWRTREDGDYIGVFQKLRYV